jgi:hyperosmotically inducible protein
MTRIQTLIAAAAGCLALLGVAQSAEPVSDSQITDQVVAKLSQTNPDQARRLQVSTKDGVVTLSGAATSGNAAFKAIQQARSVEGVVKVENRLSIQQ